MNETISLLDTIIEKHEPVVKELPKKKTLNRSTNNLLFKTERIVETKGFFIENSNFRITKNDGSEFNFNEEFNIKLSIFASKLDDSGFIEDNKNLDGVKYYSNIILQNCNFNTYSIPKNVEYYSLPFKSFLFIIINNFVLEVLRYSVNYKNFVGIGIEIDNEISYYKVSSLKDRSYIDRSELRKYMSAVRKLDSPKTKTAKVKN